MGERTSSPAVDLPILRDTSPSIAGHSTRPSARPIESVPTMPRTLPSAVRMPEPDRAPRISEIARCLDCGSGLAGRESCPGCGRAYPESHGIVSILDPLRGRNRIAGSFYDGPGWPKFRRWERLFLKVQGGEARARRQILRHLTAPPFAKVLEVGIGDGANLGLLPMDWTAFGVDIALTPLEDCLDRDARMVGRLARAEAEALPFADGTFDACWTLGGFNYFADHGAALREMKRVTRPGGTLVVADEIPNLHRYGIGHLIGLKAIDAFWLRSLGLDREFVEMVFDLDANPEAAVKDAWPDAVRHPIWGGLGYCYVDNDPRGEADSDSRLDPPSWRNAP
jgi:SAM-dependent methyltransferase